MTETKETDYVTSVELAGQLGVTLTTLCMWRKRRLGPDFIQMGPRVYRYRKVDVQRWLEAQTTKIA